MMEWNLTRFSKSAIDHIVENPSIYDSGDIRRAIEESGLLYQNDTYGCDVEWMTNVSLVLNDVLRRRGEKPVY